MSETNGRVKLLDFSALRRSDLFFVVLLDAVGDTLIPEIRGIFGEEATLKFLKIFEGVTIKIPSASVITKSLMDVRLYLALHNVNRKDDEAVAAVAGKYGLSAGQGRRVYRRIRNLVREIDR